MSYVDSLMATNERIVYETKKHWIAPLFATMTGSLLTLAGLAGLTGQFFVDGFLSGLLLWGGLLALLVGLVMLGRALTIWWAQKYIVTNQKVMKIEGILRKTAGGAGLEKINDITMEQDLLGRWLDYGTLRVLTAADESNLNYRVMRKPAEFRRAILDQKQLLDQADARYIAQAVRDGPQIAAAAPHEVSAPPTPAEPAEDIPALIERLAALRDSGAITVEEFEAKKAELLGRL